MGDRFGDQTGVSGPFLQVAVTNGSPVTDDIPVSHRRVADCPTGTCDSGEGNDNSAVSHPTTDKHVPRVVAFVLYMSNNLRTL